MIFFGGSFDPWHEGHQKIYEHLITLDEVLIGVSYNPFKCDGMFSIEDRILKIPGNAIQTPQNIVSFLNERKLTVALGADAWNSLAKWKDIDKLSKDTKFIIFKRNETIIKQDFKYEIIDVKIPKISSSEIREEMIHLNGKG